jgi:hypothetical protein
MYEKRSSYDLLGIIENPFDGLALSAFRAKLISFGGFFIEQQYSYIILTGPPVCIAMPRLFTAVCRLANNIPKIHEDSRSCL